MSVFRTALIQLQVCVDRGINLKRTADMIAKAKENGSKLIALPEYFGSSSSIKYIRQYAESLTTGPTTTMLSEEARKHSVYLIGGTLPEKEGNKIYNTCTVWNPNGKMIAKYRKLHLFDVHIPGKITYKESNAISTGNKLVTFVMEGIKVGLGVCYDIRFEEVAKLYRSQGCKLLVYPAAFSTTTGPLHFELIQRSRAIDNQLYVLGVSPARNDKGYIAWGYSQITDPWGQVIAQAGQEEDIIYADIDVNICDEARRNIPVYYHRRTDLYDIRIQNN